MSTRKGVFRRALSSAGHLVQVAAGTVAAVILVLRPDRKGSERARKNAEQIIAACRAFHGKRGHFPQALEELVPEFLPELPPAKYAGPHFGFTYDVQQDGSRHVLGWTEVIPFGRPYYVFEEDRWGYLD
jgi:hypothetical protein